MMRNLTRNDDGLKAEGFSFGAENIRENVWLEFSIFKPHIADSIFKPHFYISTDSIFAQGFREGEVVFNTGMVGNLTNPSYKGQILVLTSPMIGN
jgi:hypothetical protein